MNRSINFIKFTPTPYIINILDKAKNRILDGVYIKFLSRYKDEVKEFKAKQK